jgi:cobalt-zinc-cadmium efflux system protein
VHVHRERPADSALGAALAISLLILGIEVAAGLAAHSLALLSDAGHIVTDVVALGLAWVALRSARRPADPKRSYGYHRAGVLAGMVNGGTLVLVVLFIAYEASQRLLHPQPVQGPLVIAAAMLAVVANGYIALRLRGAGQSLNVRAAMLHVVGDLAASAAAVLAGLVIVLTGWVYADPLLSLAIAALIAWSAVGIMRETYNILMEGVPRHLNLAAMEAELEAMPGIVSVHDVHVWALDSDQIAFSCHVVVAEQPLADAEHLVREAEAVLCDHHGIGHTTIQVEYCHPCPDGAGHGAGEHNHPHPAAIV